MRHVVLVGLPGVGKTTIGRLAAKRLHRKFVDLDAHIERSFGKSVSRIFDEDGEEAFRAAEVEASAAVAGMAPLVVAPGGGWLLNSAARAHLLGTCRIIYLRVTPDAAIHRIGRGIARRPLLMAGGDPHQAMRAIYEARKSFYEGYAELTVDTGGIGRSHVVARVVELVLAAERDLANEND